jgi:hypothetical protein
MFIVRSRASGTQVSLVCSLCFQPLLQSRAVLAFPANADGAEGHWCHKTCIDGRFQPLFGTRHLVLCEATAALSHLATALRAQANGHL